MCATFLSHHASADWSATIPRMTMTVSEAVGHAANCCLWYAVDVSAGGDDLEHVQITVGDATPSALVSSLATGARVGCSPRSNR